MLYNHMLFDKDQKYKSGFYSDINLIYNFSHMKKEKVLKWNKIFICKFIPKNQISHLSGFCRKVFHPLISSVCLFSVCEYCWDKTNGLIEIKFGVNKVICINNTFASLNKAAYIKVTINNKA